MRRCRKITALGIIAALLISRSIVSLADDTDTAGGIEIYSPEVIYMTEVSGPDGVEILPGFSMDTHTASGIRMAGDGIVYAANPEEYYNAYDLGLMPSNVRNQKGGGTCWAHAAIGCMEADLILNDNAGQDIDLSELQLAYFTAHDYYDPKNCHNNDIISYWGNNYLGNGGHSRLAYTALTSLVGAIPETLAPYTDDSSVDVDSQYAMGGRTAQLKNVYEIPSDDKEGIKQAIKKYGAVAATFYAMSSETGSGTYDIRFSSGMTSSGYVGYNRTTNSYYGEVIGTNHGVMLVGWDDNYSVLNFNEECRPKNNGAWLVRNSWGKQGYGYKGYFWISYEDYSLTQKYNSAGDIVASSVFAFDASFELDDNVYSYYSYPGLYGSYSYGYAGMEQVFSVEKGEEIKAVGFHTGNANLTANVTVTDGVNSVSKTIQTTYTGFYYAQFDEALQITEDCNVTARITFQKAAGDTSPILIYMELNRQNLIGGASGGYIQYECNKGAGKSYIILNNGSRENVAQDIYVKLYTDDIAVSEQKAVSVDKAGLKLDGRTCLEFAIKASDFRNINIEGAYSIVQYGERSIKQPLSESLRTVEGEQYYVVTCGVDAKDMREKIVLNLYDGDDALIDIRNSNVVDGNGYSCSVYDYLRTLTGGDNSRLERLIASLASYGFFSECYFYDFDADSYISEVGDIIGTDNCDALLDRCGELEITELSRYSKGLVGEAEGISYLGTSLLLEAETTIRHYFYLDKGYKLEDYQIYVGDEIRCPEVCDGIFYIDIKNITAVNYGDNYKLSINGNAFNLYYSVYSYIYETKIQYDYDKNTEAQQKLIMLMNSMYLYGQDAGAYSMSSMAG